MATRTRKRTKVETDDTVERVIRPDTSGEIEAEIEAAPEEAPREPETEEAEGVDPDAGHVHLQKPYRAEGFQVFDATGQRVALVGYSHNMRGSGPLLAEKIAEALNRSR